MDVRCRRNPSKLLLRITSGNLIEVTCRDCARRFGWRVVLHRFDPAGEPVETEWRGDGGKTVTLPDR